ARGKRPEQVVTTLALRCSQAVKAGRLAGCEAATDVLSPVARVRHGLAVGRLPDRETVLDRHVLPEERAETLAGHTRSAGPEQAAFRVDVPRWRPRGGGGTGMSSTPWPPASGPPARPGGSRSARAASASSAACSSRAGGRSRAIDRGRVSQNGGGVVRR